VHKQVSGAGDIVAVSSVLNRAVRLNFVQLGAPKKIPLNRGIFLLQLKFFCDFDIMFEGR
jgi:hypothetical protein